MISTSHITLENTEEDFLVVPLSDTGVANHSSEKANYAFVSSVEVITNCIFTLFKVCEACEFHLLNLIKYV